VPLMPLHFRNLGGLGRAHRCVRLSMTPAIAGDAHDSGVQPEDAMPGFRAHAGAGTELALTAAATSAVVGGPPLFTGLAALEYPPWPRAEPA
jgi:hypothetical protein